MINKVKNLIANNKAKMLAVGTTVFLGVANVAHAEDEVTAAFTAQATSIKTTLAGVAAVGVTILTVFLAWKYGKKIFNRVAN